MVLSASARQTAPGTPQNKMNRSILPVLLGAALLIALNSRSAYPQASDSSPHVIKVDGDVQFTHDPSIIKDGATWYLFATGSGPDRKGQLGIRCSKDLHHWERCGYVFQSLPEWITKESPQTRDLWAPDISYFNGEYHLYY